MTSDDVIRLLRKATKSAGSQRAFAKQHALSPAYVSDVMLGRRRPAGAILEALGLEQHITYSRKAA